MSDVESFESILTTLREIVPDPLLLEVAGNTVLRIVVAIFAAILLGILAGFATKIAKYRLGKLAEKTSNNWDDRLARIVSATSSGLIVLASTLVGALLLRLPEGVRPWVGRAFFIVIVLQCGLYIRRAFDEGIAAWRTSSRAPSDTVIAASRFAGNMVLWSLLLFVTLSTFGVEITALLAGLGVGGVAAALAVQNILGDVFSALSLYGDRPFDIGDFIIVGDDLGTVRHIGWRSTRIGALEGQELTVPNGDLASSRINNYGRMVERRVAFETCVIFSTPLTVLKKIPNIIRECIETVENVRFDRSHLKEIASSSYSFESVYFVESADYSEYMDAMQKVLFEIIQRFKDQNITIASPRRSLYVENIDVSKGLQPTSHNNEKAKPSPSEKEGAQVAS
ncbi:MAG: mechanosensitive ion channel family protein [Myxococcota bacterium]